MMTSGPTDDSSACIALLANGSSQPGAPRVALVDLSSTAGTVAEETWRSSSGLSGAPVRAMLRIVTTTRLRELVTDDEPQLRARGTRHVLFSDYMALFGRKRRDRRPSVDLLDAGHAFRAVTTAHFEKRYRDGAEVAQAFLAHHGQLPTAAVGLNIGLVGARCALASAPGSEETAAFVSAIVPQVEAMRDLDLDETWNGFWVAPGWDDRHDEWLAEVRQSM